MKEKLIVSIAQLLKDMDERETRMVLCFMRGMAIGRLSRKEVRK